MTLKMTMVSGFGWLRGQVRTWLNDPRHFTTVLVFLFFFLFMSLLKLLFKTAQCADANARSVKRTSIDYFMIVISSFHTKKPGNVSRKKSYEIS